MRKLAWLIGRITLLGRGGYVFVYLLRHGGLGTSADPAGATLLDAFLATGCS